MASNREERMQQAISDYHTFSDASIRSVATANDVDYSTLSRRLKGQSSRSIARQPQQLLSNEQEGLLKRWILDLEAQGHAPTFNTIRELAAVVSRSTGGPQKVGKNWLSRFTQRHPEVASKVGKKIDTRRVDGTTSEALEAWFAQLHSIQLQYNILPQNTWNMDESGIALGVCNNQRVLGTSLTSSTFKKTPENREWVSIIETISTTGIRLQPLVIFKGQGLQSRWFQDNNTPDYQYTVSTNSWTSNEIGLRWLDQIFLPKTIPISGYRLLLVDGHKSHTTHEFMWKCHQHHVVVFYLLPHSSHVLQPLDLACFSLLKTRYREQLTNLARFDDTSAIKKAHFLQIYQKASQEGLSTYQIKAGWNASGIHPWNPRKVVRSRLVLQNSQDRRITPSTPPSRKRRRSESEIYSTPTNRRKFDDTIRTIIYQESVSRSVRLFLAKTSKTFDRIEWLSTQKDLQLDTQKRRLEQLNRQGQRTQEINVNETFASVENIQQAKEAVALLSTTRIHREPLRRQNIIYTTTETPPQEAFMSVFNVNTTVEE